MRHNFLKMVACVADGIVSAREIEFWRRSRQASGEAAKRIGRGTLFAFLAASKTRAYNTATPQKLYFACAIPPATQARKSKYLIPRNNLKQSQKLLPSKYEKNSRSAKLNSLKNLVPHGTKENVKFLFARADDTIISMTHLQSNCVCYHSTWL